PAAWRGGRDINALTAHIDVLPTLAEIAEAELTPEVQQHIEGRSLVPLAQNAQAEWPDRLLFTHVGRWPRGKVADYKYQACSIRNTRFRLVSPAHTNDFLSPKFELYDLEADPGETRDV